MAERVRRGGKGKGTGKVRGKEEIATLPNKGRGRGRKAKAAAPPPSGDNIEKFQGVPVTVWKKHMPLIAKAEAAKDKARDEARTAASYYRDALRAAKEEGLPTAAIIEARKLDKKDHGEMLQHFADVGQALDIMNSNLGKKQLDLFGPLNARRGEDIPSDPAKEGFAAGKRGDPADNNPYIPGGEDYVTYAENWRKGQAELAGGIGKVGEPRVVN